MALHPIGNYHADSTSPYGVSHDDVIKWKNNYWPFVLGIHRSPVNSPHKGQWHGALMFSLIRDWINGWVNNREAGDLRRHRAHYDVTVMKLPHLDCISIACSGQTKHQNSTPMAIWEGILPITDGPPSQKCSIKKARYKTNFKTV